jgi:prepilin-type N-terminal cleavage/methylation domain-containing protein
MRSGYTLVELLVAATIALVVMAAAAGLFAIFSRAAAQSQALIDLGDRMRSTAWRLRQDLAGTTLELQPWVTPEQSVGYFELIEGPRRDSDAGQGSGAIQADTDDVLLFTTRSTGGPFVGKYGANFIESPIAEVAWFCRPASSQPVAGLTLHTLYRRQLLVVGYVGVPPFSTNNNSLPAVAPTATLSDALLNYDISLRAEGTSATAFLPNTLGDLTNRENRFWHDRAAFPYAFQTATLGAATFDGTARDAEDVALTNVIAFDVRVFDPEAPTMTTGGVAVFPGDPGYGAAAATAAAAKGAHVDLGWGGGSPTATTATFPPSGQTAFQSGGVMVSSGPRNLVLGLPTYDTWSRHYEFNGSDEDGDGKIDEGSDGFDDNGDDLADDQAEQETSPPYPVPLRGLEVRIRCYEPSSRQVRQITIRHTFLAK